MACGPLEAAMMSIPAAANLPMDLRMLSCPK
jgi:hypothetical protein